MPRPLVALAVLVSLAALPCRGAEPLPDLGEVGSFSLTERSGRTVTNNDLRGKVWIASFLFTRCNGECPQVSATVHRLQNDLTGHPDILFVTFTVDPEHDDPKELTLYAEKRCHADPQRWLFLTGSEKQLASLIRNQFHLFAQKNTGAERKPGREVAHDQRLVLVDRQGHIRGYYDGMRNQRLPDPEAEYKKSVHNLERDAIALERPPAPWYLPEDFPRFNALLNAASAVLLVLGYVAIRRRLIPLHKACMLTALAVSALFLTSYLYYHLAVKKGQPTRFAEQAVGAPAWAGYVYFGILTSHTVLAAVVAPLALFTTYQGLRGRFKRHARVARWTLPVWLYVCVTGVAVYWMLYRLYPSP